MGVVHRDIKPANIILEYPVGLGLGAPLDADSTVREQGTGARGQQLPKSSSAYCPLFPDSWLYAAFKFEPGPPRGG